MLQLLGEAELHPLLVYVSLLLFLVSLMVMFKVGWLETFPLCVQSSTRYCDTIIFLLKTIKKTFWFWLANVAHWFILFCLLSFFAGLAASGAITSALRFVTKAAFENSQDGLRKGASMSQQLWKIDMQPFDCIWYLHLLQLIYAVLFSSISCFFEHLCVLLHAFVFPKLPMVKFYRSNAASEGSLIVAADLAAGGIQNRSNPLTGRNFDQIKSVN
jgi:hypothetical protein